jgi:MFS transporter, DHA3 family, macrolide efflux protein
LSTFREHPLVQFPAFRAFYFGNVLVSAAARSVTIILCWWLISKEGEGAQRLGLLMMMQSAPILLFSVLYGPLIDRFDRRTCMLFGALAQTVLSVGMFSAFAADITPFPLVCGLLFAMSVFMPLVDDASSAALEQLVDEKSLTAASAVQSTVFELSNILAATLSTVIMSVKGVPPALGLTVALYVIGVGFLAAMGRGKAPEKKEGDAKGDYWGELREGFRYLTGTRPLAAFVFIYFSVVFFLQQTFILIPLIVKKMLNEDVKWVGILETSFSIGMVTTAFVVSTQTRHRHVYRIYAIAIAMCGLCMLSGAIVKVPHLMVVVLLTLGVFFARMWSFSSMLFQKVVPEEIKGRFFSVISTAAAGITPLSYFAVGTLSDLLSPRTTMLIDGCGLLVLAAVAIRLPRLCEHLGEEAVEEPKG